MDLATLKKLMSRNVLAVALGGVLFVYAVAPLRAIDPTHGALYQQVGGDWFVCLCQDNNQNCQPCQWIGPALKAKENRNVLDGSSSWRAEDMVARLVCTVSVYLSGPHLGTGEPGVKSQTNIFSARSTTSGPQV